MSNGTNLPKTPEGDEAPRLKHIVIVVAVVLALLVLSWLAYYKWDILN
ncbi:MAG TPA: hypothetical protein VFL47_07585 [Flavisolibacter sp.]|nr:hypothetical protein [Flavisolibacter sp.]